jgi:Putative peptidoglycan binding domain
MKKFTSLLIGCSLALAGAALAQQPDEQPTPKKKQAAGKTHTAEATPGANAAKPEATAAKQRGARNERAMPKGQKAEATPKSAASTGTEPNVSGEPTASATPGAKQQAQQRRKGMKAPAANATASPSATPAAAATASAAPTVAATGQQNAPAKATGAAKKPDPQQVQQIKSQHTNFRAQPKPQQVPAVTFNQNYRIQGSDGWQGQQYEVFRSYHPERHDQGWYRSHYTRVELIGGGYYYWNNGYWYPAWGYSPSAEYYAFDGPIYVGHRAEPPDQVIADVQAELQQMGYYKGEVDGLLGPLTREALTAYQADQGLTQTAAIDEPTLDSLGMG